VLYLPAARREHPRVARPASSRVLDGAFPGCGGSILTSLEWAGQRAPENLRSADDVPSTRCSTRPDEVVTGTAHLLIGHWRARTTRGDGSGAQALVAGWRSLSVVEGCARRPEHRSSPGRARGR